MATCSIKANTYETLTLTRTNNSYVDSTSFARLHAYKKAGILFLKFNLFLSSQAPAMTDFVKIGTISGWNAVDTVQVGIVAQSNSHYEMTVQVTDQGVISIFTPAQTPTAPAFRQQLSIPALN